ncbi:hypothetical protein JRO89_XS05G0005500 [Xanthoceras sorbifolium]|uniref:Peptidase A1 domain-containing protein n=1 Tax=Xanthoceras sorbifolium TaxID=99658 RepID=A0ABQ8HZQ1_9ROSI|nr:hypothetical protein JRO89_XS05G0005500 [Xanthoceras sorbifolium]
MQANMFPSQSTLVVIILQCILAATSYPNFQNLNVQNSKTFQNHNHNHIDEGMWKLKLVHRDHIASTKLPVPDDLRQRFHARMQRDVKRVADLTRRLSAAAKNYEMADFGADVVSGLDQGSGEYFVRIGVGSPPISQYMVIDTGSDIVWVQCQPCIECYKQSGPIFDPAASASFVIVSCSSAVCDRLDNGGCHAGKCCYDVKYGDGSYTKGTLVSETLTIGPTLIQNMAIGCGHRNNGTFATAAGLLGLGGGSLSFVGQLGGQIGGAFSYCLPSRGSRSSGWLAFGRGAFPVGAAWIPLVRSLQAPTLYYVRLSGLGVGGVRVPISEDIFRLTQLGYGGVVMDTGTAVTRLPTVAYEAFRDLFIAQTRNIPRASGISIFDTCYNLFGLDITMFPPISFHFSNGPILNLLGKNYLLRVNDVRTLCFAFAPSPSELSIIGNIQQEGIQISFDAANGYVGFGPNVC